MINGKHKSTHIRESKTVLDSEIHMPWIPDSLSVELGFQISILSKIPVSLSYIPDSKAQDSGFHERKFVGFRNLYSLIWGDISCRKNR